MENHFKMVFLKISFDANYDGTQVSTKKTESHDITEIFSKLALNSITPNTPQYL
jgi:hypothetical protein